MLDACTHSLSTRAIIVLERARAGESSPPPTHTHTARLRFPLASVARHRPPPPPPRQCLTVNSVRCTFAAVLFFLRQAPGALASSSPRRCAARRYDTTIRPVVGAAPTRRTSTTNWSVMRGLWILVLNGIVRSTVWKLFSKLLNLYDTWKILLNVLEMIKRDQPEHGFPTPLSLQYYFYGDRYTAVPFCHTPSHGAY